MRGVSRLNSRTVEACSNSYFKWVQHYHKLISWENFVTNLTSPLKDITVYEPGMYICMNATETGKFMMTYAHCAKRCHYLSYNLEPAFDDVDL